MLRGKIFDIVMWCTALFVFLGMQLVIPVVVLLALQTMVTYMHRSAKKMVHEHLDAVELRVRRILREAEEYNELEDEDEEEEDEFDYDEDDVEEDDEDGDEEEEEEEEEGGMQILSRAERAKHRATRNLLLQIVLPVTIGIMYLNGWREVLFLLQCEENLRALLQRAVQFSCPPLYEFVTKTLGVKAVTTQTVPSVRVAVPSAVFDKMYATA